VGILDNFEKGLERAVNGAFAKTFKSGLQPVEITSALKRELDTKAAVVARDRILAPNRFVVRMSRPDLDRMRGLGSALTSELTDLVTQHAAAQCYQFAGSVSIKLTEDQSLSEGMVQIDSSSASAQADVRWTPVLEINGTRHPLTKPRTVVGRGSDADITVNDTGTSRRHVEIAWDGSHAMVRDLGSTNGSQLNGAPVKQAVLEPDSVITIGRTRMVFRVLAQAAHGGPATDGGEARRRNDMDGFWGPSA
jgi:hypothetical protein